MSTTRRAFRSTPRTDPTLAARLQRDAGMERARSVTKGIAFGSVAAVAVAGVYLSQVLPGHAASSTTSTSGSVGATTPSPASSSYPSGDGSTAYGAPTAPASAPTPAYAQQPVVSSGSS